MKLPEKRRSDDWTFAALLVSVILATAALDGAWMHESHHASSVARGFGASAPLAVLVATATRHSNLR